jgi:hypothetical protein
VNWEYTASKYALRGLFRTARRSTHEQGIRINHIAPWYDPVLTKSTKAHIYLPLLSYIKSAIRSAEYEAELVEKGVRWAPPSSVSACMMKIASDKQIHGKPSYFRRSRYADSPRGHSLMVVPSDMCELGFCDVNKDDITDDEYFVRTQQTQLRVITDKWE